MRDREPTDIAFSIVLWVTIPCLLAAQAWGAWVCERLAWSVDTMGRRASVVTYVAPQSVARRLLGGVGKRESVSMFPNPDYNIQAPLLVPSSPAPFNRGLPT